MFIFALKENRRYSWSAFHIMYIFRGAHNTILFVTHMKEKSTDTELCSISILLDECTKQILLSSPTSTYGSVYYVIISIIHVFTLQYVYALWYNVRTGNEIKSTHMTIKNWTSGAYLSKLLELSYCILNFLILTAIKT